MPAGSITAIVGESGSGKSTLAKLLARLIKPTSGRLALDGREISASSRVRRSYARQVQLVLQDPFASLNPIHDVRYHLVRPLKLHGITGSGRPGGTAADGQGRGLDQAVADLLERVALTPTDQFAGKYPHELSGGQRQRVAIARALAVAPSVLLADEPVSMLDVSIRLGVLNLLADLRERDGLTIVYVTHDIASARYLADTIAVMYAGRIVESGPRIPSCCSAQRPTPTVRRRRRFWAAARRPTWSRRRPAAGSIRAARMPCGSAPTPCRSRPRWPPDRPARAGCTRRT